MGSNYARAALLSQASEAPPIEQVKIIRRNASGKRFLLLPDLFVGPFQDGS